MTDASADIVNELLGLALDNLGDKSGRHVEKVCSEIALVWLWRASDSGSRGLVEY